MVSHFLKPIMCWWALSLFPYFGSFKYCCYERCCMYLFELGFLPFINTYPLLRLIDHMVALFSVFFRNFHTVSHHGCTKLYSHQQCRRCILLSTPSPAFVICRLFNGGHSDPCEWYQIVILINISLINSDVEHLFMCLLVFCVSSLEKCLFRSSVHFLIGFLILSYMSCLCILDIKPLSVTFGFIPFIWGCLFILLVVFFAVQKLLSFIRSQLFTFAFFFCFGRLI